MKEGETRSFLTRPICLAVVLLQVGLTPSLTVRADAIRDYVVEAQVVLSENPPQIILKWPAVAGSTEYRVSRKRVEDNGWTPLANLAGDQNSYTDGNVTIGAAFEYQIIRATSAGFTGYGYVYAGLKAPLIQDRGKIILIVEKSIASALPNEIAKWTQDAVGDGWTVLRHEVSADQSPQSVQALIRADYNADPGRVNAVFLLGHVPVAYSGDIAPDGHPNHQGAWPADVFYGDVQGVWTDTTVTSTGAERKENWNVPGDGKFDQSQPSVPVKLQVGRVDLSRLTCFSNKTPSRNEIDLTRQYLDKDHRFRSGLIPIKRRAMVIDEYGAAAPEPYIAFAWRNFSGLFGSQTERQAPQSFMNLVQSDSYLFGSTMASGSYQSVNMVVAADQLAFGNYNIVFATFCGSYFGDWNNESNVLRAMLGASGALLCTSYAAQPPWLFHTMSLGQPIGLSAKITQNNHEGGLYPPQIRHPGLVHVALLGDPTVRLEPVIQPANFRGVPQGTLMNLGWDRSSADGLQGYYIYKADSQSGPFRRITPDLLTGNTFQDTYKEGQYYMLRAVALSTSPAGSYFNASQGVFFPDDLGTQLQGTVPATPADLIVIKATTSGVVLRWVSKSANETGYAVERKLMRTAAWQTIGTAPAGALEFTDQTSPPPGNYVFRIRAFNSLGYSNYSNEANASLFHGIGSFITDDWITKGNWKGIYGSQYFSVSGWSSNVPPSIAITSSNITEFNFGTTTDSRALSKGSSTLRSGGCWVSSRVSTLDFNFYDSETHRLSLYLIDWNDQKRALQIELFDPTTDQLLDSRIVSSYTSGVYMLYDLRYRARLKLTTVGGVNNLVFGMFFDKPSLIAPRFSPEAGVFPGRINVAISSPVTGGQVRYTLDGSIPTLGSTPFTSPISLLESATFTARCFKDGYDPSPVASATYVNTMRTRASELGRDDNLQGNWPGRFGSEGYWISAADKALPAFVEQSMNGAQEWVWNDNPQDSRALYRTPEQKQRIASCFYGDSWTLNLGVWDTKSHAVALYFLDWDQRGRHQTVEVLDGNGKPMASYDIQDFSRGKYLILNIQGSIQLKFTRMAGDNAVLSGIFLDPAPAALNQPLPLRQSAAVKPGIFDLTITGEPGFFCCIDGTADLRTWTCLATNILSQQPLQLTFPRGGADKPRFFRAHYLQ
jgi:hypothetical protein